MGSSWGLEFGAPALKPRGTGVELQAGALHPSGSGFSPPSSTRTQLLHRYYMDQTCTEHLPRGGHSAQLQGQRDQLSSSAVTLQVS